MKGPPMTSLRFIPRPRVSAIFPVFFCLVLTCLLSTRALAQNENETVGFSSTHIFDGGYAGENIDTLNGGLTLTIPIGPKYQVNRNLGYQLKMTYNSKVWEFVDTTHSASGTKLWGESPLGVGFALSLGRVYRDEISPGALWQWYFVTPDGNRHDMGGAQNTPLATFDLTYLYPLKTASTTRSGKDKIVITDRTGIRYTLDYQVEITGTLCPSCDAREMEAAFGGWYVTRIEDTTSGAVGADGFYPNWVKVEYEVAGTSGVTATVGFGQCIKRVVDSAGREIRFTNWWDGTDKRSARTLGLSVPKFHPDPLSTAGH